MSLTSVTGPMIPFQATIALNTLLPFSHRFFTQYTIVAYGSHSCSHVVVLRWFSVGDQWSSDCLVSLSAFYKQSF